LKKEAKAKKTKLSEKGWADAPAIFRNTKAAEYRDGAPNPDARVLGGVLVRGRIEREVTVNLVALRGIRGKNEEETAHIRKYLLGLALVAATADIDLLLREGCHLRYTGDDQWHEIPRRGTPKAIDLGSKATRGDVREFASVAAGHFRPKWPTDIEHNFDLDEAKKLLAKTEEVEPATGG